MHLVGRYEKVREVGALGYGAPWILDRGSKSTSAGLRPFKGEYWDRTRAGLYMPRIAGGIGFRGYNEVAGVVTLPGAYASTGALAQTTLALDSNYVAGTSGDATASRITLPATKTFDSVYFFITAYTGTAANVTTINLEIRADATGALPDTTGTIDTDSVNPGAATGWITKQFGTPQNLTGGTTYHVIVGDADGNTTDFATVLRHAAMMFNPTSSTIMIASLWWSQSTTGGWLSGHSFGNVMSSVCVKFSDGVTIGNPFTTAESPASNSLARGLLMSGLTEQLKIFGVVTSSPIAAYSQVDVFSGTDLSDATPFATASVPFPTGQALTRTGFYFGTSPTLAKSTQYRVVFRFGSNAAVPVKYNIGTGADASLKSAMFGGGSWYWTIDSAGPVWVDDDDAWPNMSLLVEDQVAVAAGGGNANLFGGSVIQ